MHRGGIGYRAITTALERNSHDLTLANPQTQHPRRSPRDAGHRGQRDHVGNQLFASAPDRRGDRDDCAASAVLTKVCGYRRKVKRRSLWTFSLRSKRIMLRDFQPRRKKLAARYHRRGIGWRCGAWFRYRNQPPTRLGDRRRPRRAAAKDGDVTPIIQSVIVLMVGCPASSPSSKLPAAVASRQRRGSGLHLPGSDTRPRARQCVSEGATARRLEPATGTHRCTRVRDALAQAQ